MDAIIATEFLRRTGELVISQLVGRTELPRHVFKLTHLTSLVITHTDVTTIPDEISKLTGLNQLCIISVGNISHIPDCVSTLTDLRRLNISYNDTRKYPPLENLTKLQTLCINNTLATHVPADITALRNLDRLEMGGKMDRYLDICLDKSSPLTTLTNLIELRITCATFRDFPDGVGEYPFLTTLAISYTNLTDIPVFCNRLCLSYNMIECCRKIDKAPAALYLSGNPLKHIDFSAFECGILDIPDGVTTTIEFDSPQLIPF